MDQPVPNGTKKRRFKIVWVVLSLLGLCAAGMFGYYRRMEILPLPPARAPHVQAQARLKLGPQNPAPESAKTPDEQASVPQNAKTATSFRTIFDPMEEFHQEVRDPLLRELSAAYPELAKVLGVQTIKSNDPVYRRVLFQLLDSETDVPPERRAAIELAADLVARQIWCGKRESAGCLQLREEFARRQVTLTYNELGGAYYYRGDLLWRVWESRAKTLWGQRAFLLLLDAGWDTSGTCEKGTDQFRAVIREGEAFLERQPESVYKPQVTFLVGLAYETWWSLSRDANASPDDGVDPKKYQEGVGAARTKAIAYYEQVLSMAPERKFAEYARQSIPVLRERQDTELHKFICVYD
jgi:hypothetical protein